MNKENINEETVEQIKEIVDRIGKRYNINYDKDFKKIQEQLNRFSDKQKEEDPEGVMGFVCKQVAKIKKHIARVKKISNKDVCNARSKKENKQKSDESKVAS